MLRSYVLQILVALQLLLALAWPTHASSVEDVQHRALHTVLAQHAHDDSFIHLEHETSHGHEHNLQLSNAPASSESFGDVSADHHHHDFQVSVALLMQSHEPFAIGHCIQNPRILPAMHSAERRSHLRPPQV